MLRRRWTVAIGFSLAAHAAVVLALTPRDADTAEAGSGAGSSVVGSVDAMIGVDMPVETLDVPTVSESVAAAVATEATTSPDSNEIAPVQVATLQSSAVPQVEHVETVQQPPAEIRPAEAAALEAAPSERQSLDGPVEQAVEIAAATPFEATAAPPVEADLAAAPATVAEAEPVIASPVAAVAAEAPERAAVAPALEAAAPAASTAPVAATTELAAATAETLAPIEPPVEIAAAPEAEPKPPAPRR
ncbi:MAG: hypothetical protein J0H54_08595, partial [Rhizobiales bacterium]|nr:hypothetical protein [Hyphomicrobiales bacterium]